MTGILKANGLKVERLEGDESGIRMVRDEPPKSGSSPHRKLPLPPTNSPSNPGRKPGS
jgi:hypothetical protein